MPDGSEAYYDQLFGPEAGAAGVGGGIGEKAKGLLSSPGIKQAAGGLFTYWLLNKLMQTHHERGMRGIQKASLRSQAETITPESLYYQAAQPQALQEEAMARQALTAQLMGGVIGPQQLAKGEYQIGG